MEEKSIKPKKTLFHKIKSRKEFQPKAKNRNSFKELLGGSSFLVCFLEYTSCLQSLGKGKIDFCEILNLITFFEESRGYKHVLKTGEWFLPPILKITVENIGLDRTPRVRLV